MELAQPTEIGTCLMNRKNSVAKGQLHNIVSSTRVFTAIFPKISIFNHSCDPNIRNRFDGTTLTVYATRDIGKNDEVFNSYGPNYKIMAQEERKMALMQQYCFDCSCSRCSTNDETLVSGIRLSF